MIRFNNRTAGTIANDVGDEHLVVLESGKKQRRLDRRKTRWIRRPELVSRPPGRIRHDEPAVLRIHCAHIQYQRHSKAPPPPGVLLFDDDRAIDIRQMVLAPVRRISCFFVWKSRLECVTVARSIQRPVETWLSMQSTCKPKYVAKVSIEPIANAESGLEIFPDKRKFSRRL